MKRIFPVIIVLISLSLIGIIIIQLLWINNMVLLRQEQVRHNVEDATKDVAEELAKHKGTYSGTIGKLFPGLRAEDNIVDIFKPITVGQRFNTAEIQQKIHKAFLKNDLKNIRFEFGLMALSSQGYPARWERQSKDFVVLFQDSIRNYSYSMPLIVPSGSPAENLSSDEVLIIVIPEYKDIVLKSLSLNIATAIIFTIIIIAAFYLTLRTMLRQKKLSEIKNDFINNMTHEFKTPLATISLAVDALKNEKVMGNPEKMTYFSSIIKEENQRMNRQVETILKAALMEKQEVQLMLRPLHLHEVIKDVVANFALQLEDKKGKAELVLNATNDLIDADEVHLSNLVNNLVDNSVKYAKDNVPPDIRINTSTSPDNKKIIIRLEDNGIGMTKETVKRIFEKFYRAHTGNIHNVKGFGLGLSYVKTMVEAHGGEIKVDSLLGKGSIFNIEIPLKKVHS